MTLPLTAPPAMAAAGLLGTPAGSALLATSALLLVALIAGAALWLRSRRQQQIEVRALIEALESVRTGAGFSRVRRGPDSVLSLVGDAVNRLGEDVSQRRDEAAGAGERLRAVMDAAEDTAVVTTNLDGEVTSFSRGATTLFGWDEEAVLSRPAAILFDGDSYKEFLPKLTRRSLREQGVTTRSALLRQDGSSFAGSLTIRMLSAGKRREAGFLMVVKDVTEQTRLESELRNSESRYRGLVEGLSEGVAIAQEGRLSFANPAFAQLYGVPTASLVGRPLHELVATRDVMLVEERLGRLERDGGAGETFRAQLIDAAGLPLARVAVKAGPIDYGGRPAVLLLTRDETVERRIEEELRHNEARLDAVIEAMSDGLLVLSHGGPGASVQMTNRAFAEMTGVDIREILGRPLQELRATLVDRDPALSALARLLQQPGEAPAGMSMRLGGERPRDVEVRLATLTDRSGGSLGRVVACRDMTARRRSEAELQNFAEQLQLSKAELEAGCARLETMNANLHARSAELDRLNAELQALNEMKTQLLGNVAHELQTPLVSVRGYTEMILKGRLGAITEEQRKGLTLALKNIDRLISMIDNLLSFSRAQSDLGAMNLGSFALDELLREVRALFSEQMQERNLDYRESLGHGGRPIYADRDKIAQVLTNILSNAVKFNEAGGFIEVTSTCGDDDQLFVRVADSGVGIPPDKLERIFDRAYRVDAAGDPSRPGSGIGLAIVRDILRQHGCRVHAESVEGEGTVLSFTLPLAPRDRDPGDVDDRPRRQVVPRSDAEPARDAEARFERAASGGPPPSGARPAPAAPAPAEGRKVQGPPAAAAPDDRPAKPDPAPRPRLRIIRNRKPG